MKYRLKEHQLEFVAFPYRGITMGDFHYFVERRPEWSVKLESVRKLETFSVDRKIGAVVLNH